MLRADLGVGEHLHSFKGTSSVPVLSFEACLNCARVVTLGRPVGATSTWPISAGISFNNMGVIAFAQSAASGANLRVAHAQFAKQRAPTSTTKLANFSTRRVVSGAPLHSLVQVYDRPSLGDHQNRRATLSKWLHELHSCLPGRTVPLVTRVFVFVVYCRSLNNGSCAKTSDASERVI